MDPDLDLLTAETKEGRKDERREGVVDERTTERCPLYNIYMYITHVYITCTESDAEINMNMALTLVMIIERIPLK